MFLKSNSSCLMSNFPADILIIDDERQIRRLLNLTLTGAATMSASVKTSSLA